MAAAAAADDSLYGRLVILGHGEIRDGSPRGPGNQEILLRRRPTANGLVMARSSTVVGREACGAAEKGDGSNDDAVNASVCISGRRGRVAQRTSAPARSQPAPAEESATLIEFKTDPTTDVFQVGRHDGNDLLVPGYCVRAQRWMSRFQFRITVRRDPPHEARIHAAGFDDRRFIFFGPDACTVDEPSPDAMPTSPVKLWVGDVRSWYEVSAVHGHLYGARSPPVADQPQRAGNLCDASADCNVLRPDALIYAGGVLFQWQTPERMRRQAEWDPDEFLDALNRARVQCPVQLASLRFKRPRIESVVSSSSGSDEGLRPWVFAACGHVHGYTAQFAASSPRAQCTLCRVKGPYVPLRIEHNAAVALAKPTHVFNPCGHAIGRHEGDFWLNLVMPYVGLPIGIEPSRCPFCGVSIKHPNPLNKLVFQEAEPGAIS